MGKTKLKETITEETPTQDVTEVASVVEEKPVKAVKKEAKKTETKRKKSQKYLKAAELVDKANAYPLNEAIELVKQVSYSKFEGTIEIHLLSSAKNSHGLVTLPYMAGKKVHILAFGKGADESGADTVGTDETIKELEKGRISCDVIVTTPEWMPRLARLARILGPRGLMPNPKNGTITDDLKKAVEELQSGKTEYKAEKDGKSIHLSIGKTNQPTEEITDNVKALCNAIGKSRVKKITLAPTMGPGVKVVPSSAI